jgi:hypothetical protein
MPSIGVTTTLMLNFSNKRRTMHYYQRRRQYQLPKLSKPALVIKKKHDESDCSGKVVLAGLSHTKNTGSRGTSDGSKVNVTITSCPNTRSERQKSNHGTAAGGAASG